MGDDGKVSIQCLLETKSFDKQIEEVEYELKQIDYELSKAKELKLSSKDIEELNLRAEKLNNKLIDLNKKKKELNEQNQNKFKQWLNDIGKSTDTNIKKIGKWTLAIFGVRSMYNAIRSSMSTLSQYNDDLANKLKGIQLVVASALEPVITRIVDLVYKLLGYINYISKAWFNVDLFSQANAKALKSGAKSAKDMKKSLAGFDEMNILQDTSTGGGAGGGADTGAIPIPEGEPPSWIKWIAENKDTVLDFLTQLGILIVGLKIADFAVDIFNLGKGLSDIWKTIKPLFEFIGANASVIGGIMLIVGGLYELITGILDYLENPTWENFGKILLGVGLIAAGVLLIFGGFPALIALIIGAVVALGLAIYKNWENIKGWFSKVGDWVNKSIIQPIKDKFNSLPGWMKTLIKGIINIAIDGLNGLITGLNAMLLPMRAVISIIGKVMGKDWTLETVKIPKISRLAKGGIINMPGKGVYRGGAFVGEGGPEGQVPLTNDRSLEIIGETIAKHTVINLTNITKLDNRQIAREQKKINMQNDFAFNR